MESGASGDRSGRLWSTKQFAKGETTRTVSLTQDSTQTHTQDHIELLTASCVLSWKTGKKKKHGASHVVCHAALRRLRARRARRNGRSWTPWWATGTWSDKGRYAAPCLLLLCCLRLKASTDGFCVCVCVCVSLSRTGQVLAHYVKAVGSRPSGGTTTRMGRHDQRDDVRILFDDADGTRANSNWQRSSQHRGRRGAVRRTARRRPPSTLLSVSTMTAASTCLSRSGTAPPAAPFSSLRPTTRSSSPRRPAREQRRRRARGRRFGTARHATVRPPATGGEPCCSVGVGTSARPCSTLDTRRHRRRSPRSRLALLPEEEVIETVALS